MPCVHTVHTYSESQFNQPHPERGSLASVPSSLQGTNCSACGLAKGVLLSFPLSPAIQTSYVSIASFPINDRIMTKCWKQSASTDTCGPPGTPGGLGAGLLLIVVDYLWFFVSHTIQLHFSVTLFLQITSTRMF